MNSGNKEQQNGTATNRFGSTMSRMVSNSGSRCPSSTIGRS